MAPAISLQSAVAVAGRFPVLAGVDLDLDEGTICTVLGANGAGKTSLLRLLAGLMSLERGSGTVLGSDLSTQSAVVRTKVGLMGHGIGLYEELLPKENITFALRAARLDTARADKALHQVGISGRIAKTPVGQLSAGQQRRVVLASLIARRPRLWLLDEPHASLDADARLLIGQVIEEAASGGATVVATSHEPELSVPMADTVVTMAGGVITDRRPGGRSSPGAPHVA
jgi:heme ABC exporter ATP-binding subunit CcmA